jgi:hypothetical protein
VVRKLVAAKYDGSSKRGPGRPPTMRSIQKLVVKLRDELHSLRFATGDDGEPVMPLMLAEED